ncbi:MULTISPECIES: threonine/serine exporter family protein [Anaerococcus]|uniref:Threonine/serine exporter family protein n=1 Tax=Anaerococcus cruorum TaxID=3115617 RepID=A0ABW9MXQ1_9FIRM
MSYLIQFIAAIMSTVGFALVFAVPLKTLLVSAVNGGFGWIVFKYVIDTTGSKYIAVFLSALSITFVSEMLARRLRYPASVFIIPGIINLVPGEGIYNTMGFFVNNQSELAIESFYSTIVVAGSISFGILLASSFSTSLKTFRTRTVNRTNYLRRKK